MHLKDKVNRISSTDRGDVLALIVYVFKFKAVQGLKFTVHKLELN